MSEVIMLSEREPNGDSVLVEIFQDEAALREFLAEQIIVAGDVVKFPNVTYTIERRKARTVTGKATVTTPTFPVEIEGPDLVVTMPSQDRSNRDWNGRPTLLYGVAVDENGEAYACTCLAFEHYPGPCKHMQDARFQHPEMVIGYRRA